MDSQHPSGRWRQPVAWLLRGLAGLIAIAGPLAALAAWGIMSFYADDKPNTWVQSWGPVLVYIAPSWACAFGLFLGARRLGRHRAQA